MSLAEVDLARARIRCPACERGLLTGPAGGEVRCPACGAAYPLRDGVVDLLPGTSPRRTVAQLAMEADPIVRIYESRLWRRSPWFGLALGISFERELDLILRAAELRGTETVLDLACGPGIYTRPLARRVPAGLVVGIDLSWPMLRYASRRVREERLANVLLLRGTALRLPFPPGRFDAVNCCGALHLFPDVPRVLGEIERVLAPGGRFTVAALRTRDNPVAQLASSLRRQFLGIDAFTPRQIETHLSEAGLGDVQCHHARGIWLVMTARKPAAC